MKTQLFKLVAVGTILMTAVVACKKDPKGSSSSGGGGGGGNASVINATNVVGVGVNDDIDSVKVLIASDKGPYPMDGKWHFAYEIGATKYKNNSFRVNLPPTVPNEYFSGAYHFLRKEFISDTSASASTVDVLAYNRRGEEIGNFWFSYCDTGKYYCEARYIYADRDFTVNGTKFNYGITLIFDCNIKKGWNIVCRYESGNEEGYVTQKPSNADLRWHYESYEHPKY